jgi:hypothetical protein
MDMYSKRRNGQLPLGETGHLRYLEVALVVMMALFGAGCDREPEYVVGAWLCKAGVSSAEVEGGASAAATVSAPWSTGFEDGFCSYSALGGFCYSTGRASYEIVRSPVHSGHFAAAFTVDTSRPDGGRETDVQARCVRQGVLPREAYYSAWYLIPALAKNQGNWNFFHVQGAGQRGLWDVSAVNDSKGNLKLAVYDFIRRTKTEASSVPNVPIGSWFRVQLYLRRAADATGEVIVYQDGVEAFHLTDIVTDDTNWGEWYVGNLATNLVPAGSTVYVDDVEISEIR